jgi:hypothetical protein
VAGNDGLRPWPRARDTWWVFGLAVAALGLFLVGFLVDVHCGKRGCGGSLSFRLLDLDAVGSLPRLFTTGLFLGVGFLAWRARRSSVGAVATWWTAIAVIAIGLALAKLVSLHSTLKGGSPWLTLVGGVVLAVATLVPLSAVGRRWGLAAAGPVVMAMAAYAGVALGLDLLTGLAAALQGRVGRLTVVGSTFVEELGEALSALLLLVTVRWQSAPGADGQDADGQGRAAGVAAGAPRRQAFWRAR